MSIGNRLNDVLDSSKLFSSSLDILWKPALSEGVKNGLNVSTANLLDWLANVQFAMFEAIPNVVVDWYLQMFLTIHRKVFNV